MADCLVPRMNDAALFRVVELPFCQVVMLEDWNAPPGRFFTAYRARNDFTALLGHGVVDEFRTISGPVLLAPRTIIGGIYDAGMRLADARDVEAPIDQGWPPLTVGINVPAPGRPEDWRTRLLDAIQSATGSGSAPWRHALSDVMADAYRLRTLRCFVGERAAATVIVTDAPLLPEQLERLADTDESSITVAVATGNRLPRVTAGQLHDVDVVSGRQLDTIVRAASSTVSG